MGYLYKGVCYADLPTAKVQVCSDSTTQWEATTTIYTSACTTTDFSAATFNVCRRTDGGTCTNVTMQYPTFQACDHVYTTDVIGDWFLAALVLFVGLFGLKELYNLFSGRHDE